jgi:MinD superfamily P-loop ATPase
MGGKVLVFPELCHGCGSCTLQCPERAIKEVPNLLGVLEAGPAKDGIYFAQGVLNVGEPMAVPVIRELKQWRSFPESRTIIRDAPPGNSCPVVETIQGADFVLLVTEPTPFGLHDLRLAVQLTRELGIPAGVVINRDGVGDDGVEVFCRKEGIPILMRIPLDRRIGKAVARGEALVEAFPEYLLQFRELYAQIQSLIDNRQDEILLPAMGTHSSDGVKAGRV